MSDQLKAPIVHTPRGDLREAVRSELKSLGASDIIIPKDRDDCITLVINNPESILVVDWELGPEDINAILGAAKGHHRVETRPIFLVIPEFAQPIISVAADYSVSQLHAGPISRLAIRECLQALIEEDDGTRAIRDTLVKVAECRSRGEWPLSTTLLQELVDNMPGVERIAIELAENLIHEEQWNAAIDTLKPYTKKEPPSVRALHVMGRCLMQKGDYELAIQFLEKAKIINPHNVDRLIDLGNAFLSNEQIAEAMAEFGAASELDPDNKDAKVGTSKCLLMSGEVNEALTLLKTISGPREMASIFNTAAVLSMRGGVFEKGMQLYKSALGALGKDRRLAARLHFNMGLGFRRWNKLDKAIACFERSLTLDPAYGKAQAQIEKIRAVQAQGGAAVVIGAGGGAPGKRDDFAEEGISKFNKPANVAPMAKVVGDEVQEGAEGEPEGELAPLDWEPDE